MTTSSRARESAKSTKRREELLAAALKIFSARGYDGATIRDIAQAAGVTEGLIYHYFSDKRALFSQVLHDYYTTPALEKLLHGGSPEPIEDYMLRLGMGHLAFWDEKRPHVLLRMQDALRDPETRDLVREARNERVQFLIQCLKYRQVHGEIDPTADVSIMSETFMGALTHYFQMTRLLSDQPPAYSQDLKFVSGLTNLVLDAYLIKNRPSPQAKTQ